MLLDTVSGKVLQGVPILASIEKKNRVAIPLRILPTDYAGYLSFDIEPLELTEPAQSHAPVDGPSARVALGVNGFLTANELWDIHMAPCGRRSP